LIKPSKKNLYWIIATANRQNLHSTLTKELQNYADLKEELIRAWQLKMTHKIPPVLYTVYYSQTGYAKI